MNARWILTAAAMAALGMGICSCAKSQGQGAGAQNVSSQKMAKAEEADPGEIKLPLDQTPPAVRKTIQNELQGAQLEDIAKKQRNGKTIYETDIIKPGGEKWEVNVAEDGSILSKLKEGTPAEAKWEKGESPQAAKAPAEARWREKFSVEKEDFRPTGDNHYLPVHPGTVVTLRSGIDTLTISILNDTKVIDGVKCAVLEEKETKDGKLIEISRNFLATDSETNDVYYFGEEVDNYKDGKITSHESAWKAGENGARFGLMVPGKPKVGDRYYQEFAPKVAMDRVEIVSTNETLKTPAGTFEHVVHLKETTPLEADVSHKYYAPGIGMIKDDEFELAEKP